MIDLEQQVLAKTWFYPFQLPSGRRVSTYDDGALNAVHSTRADMLDGVLERQFGPSLAGKSVLDIACHQGYFSAMLARRGAQKVLAIDARAEHVNDTRMIAQTLGLDSIRVQQSDVHALAADTVGRHDLVLMFGLIYHLENPVGALRVARELTAPGGLCLVETQLAPGMSGMLDYGSYRFVRPLKGSFGIIDETDDTHGPEASTTGICLVPSLDALFWILRKVGFNDVELVPVPEDGYEQLRHGKRAMVACRVAA